MKTSEKSYGSLLFGRNKPGIEWKIDRKIFSILLTIVGAFAWFNILLYGQRIPSIFTILLLYAIGMVFPLIVVLMYIDSKSLLQIYENGILFMDMSFWPYDSINEMKKKNHTSITIKVKTGKTYTFSAFHMNITKQEWQKGYDIIMTKFAKVQSIKK